MTVLDWREVDIEVCVRLAQRERVVITQNGKPVALL
jgi:hypothetical protein